ncbi:MAG: chromosomal replication initiator protein DnaA [Acidimicrobiales bacterium]
MQVSDAGGLWTACAQPLRAQVSEATWRTWFEGVEALAVEGETLVLSVPSSLAKERIEARYLAIVHGALTEATGADLEVRLDVRRTPHPELEHTMAAHHPLAAGDKLTRDDALTMDPPEALMPPVPVRAGRDGEAPLNPRYTFEAFVIGASNRFAHAAALSVAEAPAKSYNPLFIHGAAGLGKTHLLHAIGNYVRQNFPSRHVRYVSTETFMNEFVDAIRSNSTSVFKRRYRECDVLLVDDIQFMEKKESLQEEFFHTFNSLYEASRQIVITSDRPPKSIATLEDRLRSRFLSGLITDVQPPELETRLAILRSKAEADGAQIEGGVLEFIATHVHDNIRELEGALIRVCAFASLNHAPLTLDLAERVLSDIVSVQPRRITPAAILEATADAFGFGVEELKGTSRRRPLVTARQVGMYVFRELTDFSYPAIAKEFGGRDHTTVMHAVEKISALMRERRHIYDQVTELLTKIRGGG